jgi:meiotically up-regulated gene 157 (Mug157) protein
VPNLQTRTTGGLILSDYVTADNAMLSVELGELAQTLDAIGTLPNISHLARTYSMSIRNAVLSTTIGSQGIFAYETNGFGGQYYMDDANVPSLVSFPYLGFMNRDDEAVVKTKQAMFSRKNPYYAEGPGGFSGIGWISPCSHEKYCDG